MSCLISFVWDQSTCQERVESDKIQNDKSLAHSWTRTHNLEICSAVLYRLSYPGFEESCAIKVTFIHTRTSNTNGYKFENDEVEHMYCFVLHIGIYLYWTNSKESHESCILAHGILK